MWALQNQVNCENDSLPHLVLGCQTMQLMFVVVVIQFTECVGGLDLVLTTHCSPNTSAPQILRFDGNKHIWNSIKAAPVEWSAIELFGSLASAAVAPCVNRQMLRPSMSCVFKPLMIALGSGCFFENRTLIRWPNLGRSVDGVQ